MGILCTLKGYDELEGVGPGT